MTPMSLIGLFLKKLQPKVGLPGYDILFAYFIVEAKSQKTVLVVTPGGLPSVIQFRYW